VLESEGNLPVLWVRDDAAEVSLLGLTGGFSAFAFNYSYPPDFAQRLPSYVRIDSGARNVTLAAMIDQGFGSVPPTPYWPPSGGGCAWEHHYPYPGEALAAFPFGTWPNATMWNCWFGYRVSNSVLPPDLQWRRGHGVPRSACVLPAVMMRDPPPRPAPPTPVTAEWSSQPSRRS